MGSLSKAQTELASKDVKVTALQARLTGSMSGPPLLQQGAGEARAMPPFFLLSWAQHGAGEKKKNEPVSPARTSGTGPEMLRHSTYLTFSPFMLKRLLLQAPLPLSLLKSVCRFASACARLMLLLLLLLLLPLLLPRLTGAAAFPSTKPGLWGRFRGRSGAPASSAAATPSAGASTHHPRPVAKVAKVASGVSGKVRGSF